MLLLYCFRGNTFPPIMENLIGTQCSDQPHPQKLLLPCDLDNWTVVQQLLGEVNHVSTVEDMWSILLKLHCTVNNVNITDIYLTPYQGLHYFFYNLASGEECDMLLDTLRYTARRADQIEMLKPPDGLVTSKKQVHSTTGLSTKFIASILACGFLCLFPEFLNDKRGFSFRNIANVNFTNVYSTIQEYEAQAEKVRFIMHYFKRDMAISSNSSSQSRRSVLFSRKVLGTEDGYSWRRLYDCRMPMCEAVLIRNGSIEDAGYENLQVDFANASLGGGVLDSGMVQEEIRFCICPELMAGMLFMERMDENEAIVISGFERFSNYSGYSHSTKFTGDYIDRNVSSVNSPSTLIAIDASNYKGNQNDQYNDKAILREFNKAYVGFKQDCQSTETDKKGETFRNFRPIATGNWGCGAFRGDAQLKSFIQWLAASVANCPTLLYHSFEEKDMEDFDNLCQFIRSSNMNVADVARITWDYSDYVRSIWWGPHKPFYKHVRDCMEITQKNAYQRVGQQHDEHSKKHSSYDKSHHHGKPHYSKGANNSRTGIQPNHHGKTHYSKTDNTPPSIHKKTTKKNDHHPQHSRIKYNHTPFDINHVNYMASPPPLP